MGTVCRKQARRVVEGKTEKLVVTREVLKEFLGGIQVRVDTEVAERVKRPGVAVGLAWTPAGGDILFIEANKMKGKGNFTMTGQIGEVMQESMQAALTWVRSNAASSWAWPRTLPRRSTCTFTCRPEPFPRTAPRPA
jgi:ATP-dependent Lon protease